MALAGFEQAQFVVLSGAGLSSASGVPTFRDGNGLWENHRIEDVATPDAWFRNRELVRRFYDARRAAVAKAQPNAGHLALARLQQELGPERVMLVTQNIDGLLTRAGAPEVIEMHGSLAQLRCEFDESHPLVAISGPQPPDGKCAICGSLLRPAVVWFEEMPLQMERIFSGLQRCSIFVSVGTSGVVYPAAGFAALALANGATCIEVNARPSGGRFHHVVAQGAEIALPRLVAAWLEER